MSFSSWVAISYTTSILFPAKNPHSSKDGHFTRTGTQSFSSHPCLLLRPATFSGISRFLLSPRDSCFSFEVSGAIFRCLYPLSKISLTTHLLNLENTSEKSLRTSCMGIYCTDVTFRIRCLFVSSLSLLRFVTYCYYFVTILPCYLLTLFPVTLLPYYPLLPR